MDGLITAVADSATYFCRGEWNHEPEGGAVPVEAEALVGNVAYIDDGCSHLHISLTRLEECREVPEPLVMEGRPLEDCGGDNCWQGAQLPP